jgi:hypothetical protein
MLTASSLPRAEACPASCSLPQVRTPSSADASRGTTIHAYVENALYKGRDYAISLVPDDLRATCEGIDLGRLFGQDGGLVSCEVPLAYDAATDTARFLERGAHRDYRGLGPTEIPGTADVIETWGEPVERVRISDLKTGFAQVSSDTLQLAFYGLAVARIFGLDSCDVRIIQLDERGGTKIDERTYDAFDLLTIAGRIAETLERVEAARVLVAQGREPDTRTGEHCNYCQVGGCPSRLGLARGVLGDLTSGITERLAAATDEEVGALVAKMLYFGPLWERLSEGLKAETNRRGRVPLPDGREYISKSTTVRSVAGKVALPILREEFGPVVDGSAEPKLTLKEIERLAGDRFETVMLRLHQAGAIHEKSILRHETRGKARALT